MGRHHRSLLHLSLTLLELSSSSRAERQSLHSGHAARHGTMGSPALPPLCPGAYIVFVCVYQQGSLDMLNVAADV